MVEENTAGKSSSYQCIAATLFLTITTLLDDALNFTRKTHNHASTAACQARHRQHNMHKQQSRNLSHIWQYQQGLRQVTSQYFYSDPCSPYSKPMFWNARTTAKRSTATPD